MKKFAAIICFLSVCAFCCFAQTKDELANKKKQIENEILYTNKLLNETEKNKDASLNQLAALKRKIQLRQSLIETINKEIGLLDRQIRQHSTVIESLENDLKKIKNEYAAMLCHAYKYRNSNDRMIFLFSARDFNQANKRLKYLKQYAEFRHKQAGLIMKTKKLIDLKLSDLELKRNDKNTLLNSKKKERESLALENSEQNSIYNKLQKKEVQLKNDLSQKQEESKRLQKAIEDIIAEELRRAREAAKKSTGFALTPEEEKLSATFASNKGKLPWPVKFGIITGEFGEQDHPVLKGIKINNNGIDISTNQGAVARAIFDGVVTGVIILPGSYKKVIIVRHGEYFTVYGNLQDVFVKKDDKVSIKQDIGNVFFDEKKIKAEAHLEIWKLTEKGTVKINPQDWLLSK